MNKEKIQIRVPPNGLIDPARLRAQQIADEEMKRFEKLTDEILKFLKKENVLVSELPIIIQLLTGKINKKIDGASVDKILNLREN